MRHRRPPPELGISLAAALATSALVLSIFSGHFDSFPGSVPLSRIAFLLLVLAVIPRLVATRPRMGPVHVFVGLQAALAVCSAAYVGTLSTTAGFFPLADDILLPAALLVIAPLVFSTHQERLLLLKALTVVGLYAGIVSACQVLGGTQLLVPRYLSETTSTQGEILRAGGPFLQPAADGAALAMCIPAAVLLYRISSRPWRVVATVSIVACTVGAFFTLTRSVWLALLAAFVVYFTMDRRLRSRLPMAMVSVVALVILLVFLVPGLQENTIDRLNTSRSIEDRSTTNAAALSMFWSHPITGVGWGRFLDVVDEYVRQPDLAPLTATHIIAHNVFLSRMAELGAVGALLFLGTILTGPAFVALRAFGGPVDDWQRVLVAMFASWLCVAMLSPMGYPFPNYLLWAVTGMALRPASGLRKPHQADSTVAPR